MFNKLQRAEFKFCKVIVKTINKENFTEKDLDKIYKQFIEFCKRGKLDELALLRKGEVMLGEYCEVNLKDINDVHDLLKKCIYNIEEISVPIAIVTIAALTKLALAEINGKETINLKENNENDL